MSVSRLHEVLAYCTTADEFYKYKDNIIRELSRLYDMSDSVSLASRAAIPPAPSAPDGWQLVPVEPTQAMIDAHTGGMVSGGAMKAYREMLAAAPAPGGE